MLTIHKKVLLRIEELGQTYEMLGQFFLFRFSQIIAFDTIMYAGLFRTRFPLKVFMSLLKKEINVICFLHSM